VAQRLHPLMQEPRDDNALAPVIEASPQVVDDMCGGAAAPGGDFDVKGPDPRREIFPLTRAGAIRLLGDHLDRSFDERRILLPLCWPELPRGLSQNIGDVGRSSLGQSIAHRASASSSAAMSATDRFDRRPARASSTPMPTSRRRISILSSYAAFSRRSSLRPSRTTSLALA